jgi:DNA-binding NarL/FixJ family response regulator
LDGPGQNVDNRTLTNSGLARLLSEAGVEVVGEATDADDLLRMVTLDQPDVRSSTSASGIAGELGISERTVKAASAQMFRKLGLEPSPDVNRRVLAVLTLLRS